MKPPLIPDEILLDVARLRDGGKNWPEVGKLIQKHHAAHFKGRSMEQVIRTCRNAMDRVNRNRGQQPDKAKDPAEALMRLLERGADLGTLSKQLRVSERVASAMVADLKAEGFNVREIDGFFQISKILPVQENRVKETWRGENVIRFGLTGDCHINSKYTQLTFLHELYDLYAREGISTVYHTGDLDEGERMRPGHQYECYTQGADDHIAEIVRVYPRRPGITTKYILGNHDHAFIKHVGLDIGPQISGLREDMVYIGQSAAVVELTDGCTLELRHPWDGSAYALSYKPQKMIDAMSSNEKPRILAIGNYHKAEYLFYRNIHVFQSATTQAQTPWMRSKQISAHLGGWLVEAFINDDGSLARIRQEFIPCYKAIKDDYLNWR